MFAGSHLLTIDDKGRLAIPARFRQQLADDHGTQVFITRSYLPCVEIYPATHFRAVADQIESLADRARADWLTQIFIGNAVETEVDKQGRVLLPQLLRKYAKLDSAVVVVGQNKRMDVWSETVWTQKFGEEASADLAGAFALLKR
jgi:MraZ protein